MYNRFTMICRSGPRLFYRTPDGYILCESDNDRQLCRGGKFSGETLVCTLAGFRATCRRWVRAAREGGAA